MALVSMSLVGPPMNDHSDARKANKERAPHRNGRVAGTSGVKRNITQSSSFMDALDSSTQLEKKRPRVVSEKKRRRSSEDDLLGGIYNKMNKMNEPSSMGYLQPTASRSPPQQSTHSPPPPERVTKIKFADDFGRPLVDVRYFEVEEGERGTGPVLDKRSASVLVNVNSLSHEEIRAMEVQMEKKALGKFSGHQKPNVKIEPLEEMESTSTVPSRSTEIRTNRPTEKLWCLRLVDNLPKRTYGTSSTEAKVEAKRQQSALEAFYVPGRPAIRFEEPGLTDSRPSDRHLVKTIPLDCPQPARQSSPTTAPASAAQPSTVSQNASSMSFPAMTTVPVSSSAPKVLVQEKPVELSLPTPPTVAATNIVKAPEVSSKVMSLLSSLKKSGILQSDQKTEAAPAQGGFAANIMATASTHQPMMQTQSMYAQAAPTYQQEFYLPAAATQMPPINAPISHGYNGPPTSYSSVPTRSATQAPPIQHAYVATMPPAPSTPHFSSQSAPALPVTGKETFGRMPMVVPPPPRNVEQSHHFERPVKPRGPFNGPVMGGYRQCRAYGTPEGCSFGDRCRYAHGDQPPPAAAGVRRNAARNDTRAHV